MTLDDVHRLIPEHSLVQDAELREKCAEVWQEVLEIGGWDSKNINTSIIAVKEVSNDCPETGLDHVRHVVNMSAAIYYQLKGWMDTIGPCDRDTVIAGALLHDVGKFLEYEVKDGVRGYSKYGKMFRHPCSGAYFAQKHGLPPKVVHIILTHSAAQSPEGANAMNTPESLVVKYADHLCFSYVQLHFPPKDN